MSQFDEVINRSNTHSLKYDFTKQRNMPDDILPMWVADMDFRAPKEVNEALKSVCEHGIYGYSDSNDDYVKVLKAWFMNRFSWEISRTWLVKTPGIVYAVATAIRGLTEENDGILIQEPVYYPFRESIEVNHRRVVVNELRYDNGQYSIDFEDFEQKIVEQDVKLFILCSPHNPVGRVWSKEELLQLGNICLKHKVLIIADEIHADFTFAPSQHTVFTTLHKAFEEISIVCTSPTKTFNLAGLQISNIFIMNESIRHRFRTEMQRSGYSQLNLMGIVACQAAYEFGAVWMDELKEYLHENLTFLKEFFQANLPSIKVVEPQGTYLVWLDFSGLNLSDREIKDILVNQAKVWLDHGTMFGESGYGFQRINIACPRETLEKGLKQIADAFK